MTGNITYVKQKSGVIYAYENLGISAPGIPLTRRRSADGSCLEGLILKPGQSNLPTTVTNGLRRSMFRSLTRRITKCHAPLRKEARKSSGF